MIRLAFSILLLLSSAMAEEVGLYSVLGDDDDNSRKVTYSVSTERIEAQKPWDPSTPIPLSPDAAVRIASEWLHRQPNAKPNMVAADIRLIPFHPPKYRDRWLYHIRFKGDHLPRRPVPVVIVLFDGTVVEPVYLDPNFK